MIVAIPGRKAWKEIGYNTFSYPATYGGKVHIRDIFEKGMVCGIDLDSNEIRTISTESPTPEYVTCMECVKHYLALKKV